MKFYLTMFPIWESHGVGQNNRTPASAEATLKAYAEPVKIGPVLDFGRARRRQGVTARCGMRSRLAAQYCGKSVDMLLKSVDALLVLFPLSSHDRSLLLPALAAAFRALVVLAAPDRRAKHWWRVAQRGWEVGGHCV